MPIAGEDQRDIDLLDTTRAHRIGAVADAVAASTSAIAMGWIGRMYHLHRPSRMGGLMEIEGEMWVAYELYLQYVSPSAGGGGWPVALRNGARAIKVEDWP